MDFKIIYSLNKVFAVVTQKIANMFTYGSKIIVFARHFT